MRSLLSLLLSRLNNSCSLCCFLSDLCSRLFTALLPFSGHASGPQSLSVGVQNGKQLLRCGLTRAEYRGKPPPWSSWLHYLAWIWYEATASCSWPFTVCDGCITYIGAGKPGRGCANRTTHFLLKVKHTEVSSRLSIAAFSSVWSVCRSMGELFIYNLNAPWKVHFLLRWLLMFFHFSTPVTSHKEKSSALPRY